MFERFTTAARAAVVAAQTEARDLRSPRIGAVHVLLGVLVVEADSPLGRVCADSGLTADGVRAELADGAAGRPLGEEDAEALRSIGIDLDAVRDSIEANFGADALDARDEDERKGWFTRRSGHIPFTAEGKKAIELALREALARKDREIRAEHLALGLLRGAAPDVVAVIAPHIAPADLRREVLVLLDRAA
ncbi:Clp protease N-terminal domain-containing protein [Rhodococcus sp. NPDC003318]|uniref:Clp protease N-terminal domain-containing protein n=1 Tax=Rhodococcus sp. NPDC003318 TaxID=3364503 RepID=UPI0036C30428